MVTSLTQRNALITTTDVIEGYTTIICEACLVFTTSLFTPQLNDISYHLHSLRSVRSNLIAENTAASKRITKHSLDSRCRYRFKNCFKSKSFVCLLNNESLIDEIDSAWTKTNRNISWVE